MSQLLSHSRPQRVFKKTCTFLPLSPPLAPTSLCHLSLPPVHRADVDAGASDFWHFVTQLSGLHFVSVPALLPPSLCRSASLELLRSRGSCACCTSSRASQKTRFENPCSTHPLLKSTRQATDPMSNSSKSDPTGNSSAETTADGSASRGAQLASAHAAPFSASNIWATRTQKQQPVPVPDVAAKGTPVSASAPPSATMSRSSSSRKPKTQIAHVPQLDDANEWPDVRDTLQPPTAHPEKEIGERSTNVSTSHKKGASCSSVSPDK